MKSRLEFPDGGFAFLEGVFPYSQGVVALAGFVIERVRFAQPVPLAEGFRRIEAHLAARGRPRTAFCACELRSPRPFSFEGFADFNRGYVAVLEQWKLFRDGVNPVARSNVAPVVDAPAEPSFHAFSYTIPAAAAAPTFVVAGSGEWPEGGKFPQDIVARGDTSAEGMRSKAKLVLETMERRMRGARRLRVEGFDRGAGLQRIRAADRRHRAPLRFGLAVELLPAADRGTGFRDGRARPRPRARAALVGYFSGRILRIRLSRSNGLYGFAR